MDGKTDFRNNPARSLPIVLGYTYVTKILFAIGFLAVLIILMTQLGFSVVGMVVYLMLSVGGFVLVGSLSSAKLLIDRIEILTLWGKSQYELENLTAVSLVRARGAGLNIIIQKKHGNQILQHTKEVSLTLKEFELFKRYLLDNGFFEKRFDQNEHPTTYALFSKE